ncbi:hypothetical protein GJV26_11230 [Massilia dura]|uniref:Uncharacterized protein n=1 Tax=Pseudoduganella dura TaxID=321982 RepID=A0A6I3XK77_9BURK|nr:hypothetical protein [Pseudoduganella dura]MUI13028.1 hypothetical protein [Pseudoduganella dura]
MQHDVTGILLRQCIATGVRFACLAIEKADAANTRQQSNAVLQQREMQCIGPTKIKMLDKQLATETTASILCTEKPWHQVRARICEQSWVVGLSHSAAFLPKKKPWFHMEARVF